MINSYLTTELNKAGDWNLFVGGVWVVGSLSDMGAIFSRFKMAQTFFTVAIVGTVGSLEWGL